MVLRPAHGRHNPKGHTYAPPYPLTEIFLKGAECRAKKMESEGLPSPNTNLFPAMARINII